MQSEASILASGNNSTECSSLSRNPFLTLWLSLPSLDVDVQSPDEKSVITYVSTLYDAFPKVPEGVDGISANVS